MISPIPTKLLHRTIALPPSTQFEWPCSLKIVALTSHKSRDRSYSTMGLGLDIIYMNYAPVSCALYEEKYSLYMFLSLTIGGSQL